MNVLTIDGKRFERVRGVNSFYLFVPHTNAILFIADEKDYSVTYHVFNMDTDEDTAIPARNSIFGQSIGLSTSKDVIERVDGEIITLSSLDNGAKSTLPSLANLDHVKSLYCLDMAKKAVVAEKTIFFDKAGKVIEQHDGSPPF